MTYLRLPVFRTGIRVDAENALQDKMSVKIDSDVYVANSSTIYLVLNDLRNRQYAIPGNEGGVTRNYFSAASTANMEHMNISFVKRERKESGLIVYGKPLISGTVHFKEQRSSLPRRNNDDDESLRAYKLSADLNLNPTRMLYQQSLPRSLTADEIGTPHIELLSQRGIVRGFNEFSLDGKDNVLILSVQRNFSRPPFWKAYRDEYLHSVHRFITNTVNQAFNELEEHAAHYSRFRISLKSIETYWEFQSEDPIRDVWSIGEYIQLLGNASLQRQYEYGVEGNSPTISVDLAVGVRLVIYAKTSRRIRFEMRHTLSRARNRPMLPNRHVFDNMGSAIDLIDSVATDAANLLNEALVVLDQYLPDQIEVNPEKPYKLIWEIMKAVDDEYRLNHSENLNMQEAREVNARQQALISIIINNNVYRTVDHDAFSGELRRLKRREVMVGSRRSYRLSSAYQRARSALLEHSDEYQYD